MSIRAKMQLIKSKVSVTLNRMTQEFERRFPDFASLEPVASHTCFPSGTYNDVDDFASKVETLFLLDTAAAENEILTLQNDVRMKCGASTVNFGTCWPPIRLPVTACHQLLHP